MGLNYWRMRFLLFLAMLCCIQLIGSGGESRVEQNITEYNNNREVFPHSYNRDSKLCSQLDSNLNFCSPWVYCDNGECKCGEIPYDIIQCSVHTPRTLSVLNSNCVTYNEKEELFEAGSCMYTDIVDLTNVEEVDLPLYTLPRNIAALNDFLCGQHFNRTGTLCGKCKEQHYPLVHSFDLKCIRCPDRKFNWWKFVLAVFLPLTIFYVLVFFLKLNTTSSQVYGFVIYSQIISAPPMMRLFLMDVRNQPVKIAFRSVQLVYGVWNLDFLRSFDLGICLQTTSLQTVALEYAVGIYPQLLLIPTYLLIQLHDRNFRLFMIIWRPFQKVINFIGRKWEIRSSLIDAFATFFLLSNLKFLSVAFDLLVPVQVYQLNSTGHLTHTWRLYYDATIPYFGPEHRPYAILAVTVLIIFAAIPTLLLILYPFRWFQKALNLFPFRWYILHTFMDSFQGCYKDGTEPGPRDYRWFASVNFLMGYLLMTIGALSTSTSFFALASIALISVAILFIAVQPFKQKVSHYTNIMAIVYLLLAVWYMCSAGIAISKWKGSPMVLALSVLPMITLAGIIPLLYMFFIIGRWIFSHRRFAREIFWGIHGYKRLA